MAEEHNAIKYGTLISSGISVLVGGGYGDVGISRVSESIHPSINPWDVSRPEFHLPRGERHWAVSPSIAAVPAEFQAVGIQNPPSSGLLVVIKDVAPVVTTNGVFEFRVRAIAAVDAVSTPNSRDTRVPFLTSIRCVSTADSNAVKQGSILLAWSINNGTYSYYPVDVVLSPGFECFVGSSVVNFGVQCTFRGYERVALPGELQARG